MIDNSNNSMSEPTGETSVKRGCVTFVAAILILGALAGASVLIFGKQPKPKARAAVLSKQNARIEEVKGKIAADVPADVRENFVATFSRYSDDSIKYGSTRFAELTPIGESLRTIEADGTIDADEAARWADETTKVLDALEKR